MVCSDATRNVVLASMFAVMIAMGSLSLTWFSATYSDGRYSEFTLTDYYIGSDGWRDYGWGFAEMGGLMGLTVVLIVVWGLLAAIHVGRLLSGERGLVSGIVLMAVSVSSVLVPCAGAPYAIVDGLASYYSSAPSGVSVSPEGGCGLAIMAAIIQVLAVATYFYMAGSKSDNDASAEASRGDLPVR